jgi:hypothetical protein
LVGAALRVSIVIIASFVCLAGKPPAVAFRRGL